MSTTAKIINSYRPEFVPVSCNYPLSSHYWKSGRSDFFHIFTKDNWKLEKQFMGRVPFLWTESEKDVCFVERKKRFLYDSFCCWSLEFYTGQLKTRKTIYGQSSLYKDRVRNRCLFCWTQKASFYDPFCCWSLEFQKRFLENAPIKTS